MRKGGERVRERKKEREDERERRERENRGWHLSRGISPSSRVDWWQILSAKNVLL